MGTPNKRPADAKLAFSLIEDVGDDADSGTLTPRDPPREFRIFAAGENTALKAPYTFLFDEVAAKSVMDAFARQTRGFLHFDYEHGATLGDGGPKPSAGRWVPEIRDGELWATNIQWTPRAAEMIAAREYELFSPWFTHEEDPPHRVLTILNCALTNTPALENAMPLIAASAAGADMDPKEKEIEELKAALAAKDEELKALGVKLAALAAEGEEEEEVKDEETKAALSLKTSLAAVTGKSSVAAALGVVEQWKGQAAVAARLTAQVEADKAAKLSVEFEDVFTKAKEGGVAVASANDIKAKALKFGGGKVTEAALDFATSALGVAPKVGARVDSPSAALGLSGGHSEVLGNMGIDPKKFAEYRANKIAQG